jgi:hypothetical protein
MVVPSMIRLDLRYSHCMVPCVVRRLYVYFILRVQVKYELHYTASKTCPPTGLDSPRSNSALSDEHFDGGPQKTSDHLNGV